MYEVCDDGSLGQDISRHLREKPDAVCDTNASQSNKTFLCGNTRQ